MSATGYVVDIRDIEFVLFEQLKVQEKLAEFEAYEDFDVDMYKTMLEQSVEIAADVIWPMNVKGDRVGCTFHGDGKVTTPEGYPEAWKMLAESGMIGYTAPAEWGGSGLPEPVAMGMGEILTGAGPGFSTYGGLARGVANLLMHYGTDWEKETFVEKLNSGEWCGTMCLTEAGAGSSVGDNRCKATPTDEEGVYLLEGEKIFITGGDHDLTPNIIHLVLARLPDAPDGSKGLSIFVVPKFHVDSGERNDAFVVGIEHKMGINGSATCTLALGATGPCKGWIIGKPGDGLPIMFHMMNEARIAVGIQGLSSAAAAYQNALSYAKERIQGTALSDFGKGESQRVTIINHPDVRRMLMDMRVYTELLRSVLYTTAQHLCIAEHTEDEGEKADLMAMVELMTPICKAYATDVGYNVCVSAMQVFGGYGYTQEYPVEQHTRDSKIASIYEGTNGIQAMDLLGRKMRAQRGMIFMKWLQQANKEISGAKETGEFNDEVAKVEKAISELGQTAMYLSGKAQQGKLEEAFVNATPFLELFGLCVLGIHALEQARVAYNAIEDGASDADESFYEGKFLNLRYFANNLLPKAHALSAAIRSGDDSCLDESLFA